MTPFSDLSLIPELFNNLASLGYHQMTAIQQQSIKPILAGQDVQAQAKTGSGKTAAFGLGLLQQIDFKQYQTQALILCPTRELADQVAKEIRRLARAIANIKVLTLCGGSALAPQLASLKQHSPHIVVGTAGRILKHLEKNTLNLTHLKTLVLDEADRMLDMGFYDDIIRVIKKTPPQRQTLLFSATFPNEIKKISQQIQKSPLKIQVESVHNEQKIKQVFYEIDKNERETGIMRLLEHYQPESSLIFCNRKEQCRIFAKQLWQRGFHALALHGDLDQKERDQVLLQFSNKSSSILVATDVAARGLDIKDLTAVINFELSPDPEIHIHRIGRTGRADKEGLALSLFTPSETKKIKAIETYQNRTINIKQITELNSQSYFKLVPPMVTLHISGGKKAKLRAGDILGALTKNTPITGNQIGKIDLFDYSAYVAVELAVSKQAFAVLNEGKIKGRKFKVRRMH